jgi:broad specificity phosphatase PhoE
MTDVLWQIPPSVLRHVERTPLNRAVVVLLRHSVRAHLPPGDVGYAVPITNTGERLALELGIRLKGRLCTLHSSPLPRCIQTAEALATGAQADIPIVTNRLLGDPGVFVLDAQLAWSNWERLGHEGVVHHLVTEPEPLPGMARTEDAAHFLVQTMLATAGNRPGVHVFVTHDVLVIATAAKLLCKSLDRNDWPWYLEGAFFWREKEGIHSAYRDEESVCVNPFCDFAESDCVVDAKYEPR